MMEKYGVVDEKSAADKKRRSWNDGGSKKIKTASRNKGSIKACIHPYSSRLIDDGVVFCSDCGEYLKR